MDSKNKKSRVNCSFLSKNNKKKQENKLNKFNIYYKKQIFLNTLKSSKLEFKRYTKSPLRYAGGKSLAVGIIISKFPNNLKRLISPFLGGGSVEIASCIELGLKVISFDIFDILVNFWNVLKHNSKDLYKELIKLEPTKEIYEQIKSELKSHYLKKIKLDSLTLARDYYFNFNLSYGPGFLGWMSKIYNDKNRYVKMLEKIKNIDISKLSINCQSFEYVFKKYPNDFFYCDPPYFLDGNSKMFKGIYPMRNFPIHHKNFNHQLLSELLNSHNGKFILSYNDCDWVRNQYKQFKIIEPKWQYTMGQGETRIGKNRIIRGDINNIKQSHELLIMKI